MFAPEFPQGCASRVFFRDASGAPAVEQLERAAKGQLHPTRHPRIRGKFTQDLTDTIQIIQII